MSKGLEEIKTLRGFNKAELNNDKNVNESLDIIEDELKVLEIIKEYQVDIWLLLNCNYDDYIRIRKECLIENKILVDNEEKTDVLPEEFFYYLNEVLLKNDIQIVEKELTTKTNKDFALEIIINKYVDIHYLEISKTVEEYNEYAEKETLFGMELTEEEFDLLKRYCDDF